MIFPVSTIAICLLMVSASGSDTLIDGAVHLYETRHLDASRLMLKC